MRGSNEASGSVLSVMVGASIFVAVVATALYATQESDTPAQPRVSAQIRQGQAYALSDLLVGSPGHTSAGGNWAIAPGAADGLQRLGLREADSTHLNFTKFDNLRLAPFAANPNDGYVNYPEAVVSLGFEAEPLDFHLRAYPTLKSVQEILATGYKDPHLRIAYVGDIGPSHGNGGGGGGSPPPDPGAGIEITDVVCKRSAFDSKVFRIEARVKNGGTTTTMFQVVFDAKIANGPDERRQDVTTTLTPLGGSAVVGADFATKGGFRCANVLSVDVEVSDTTTNRLAEKTFTPVTLVAPDAASPVKRELWLRGASPDIFVPTGSNALLNHDGPNPNDGMDVTVRDLLGVKKYELLNAKSKDLKPFSVPSAGWMEGNYTVFLKHRTSAVTVTHQVIIVAAGSPPVPYSALTGGGGETGGDLSEWSEAAQDEVTTMEALVERFCPYYFDSTTVTPIADITWTERCAAFRPPAHLPAQVGDVFPHTQKILQQRLAARLIYPPSHPQAGLADINSTQVLVIGSDVDHQGMVHIKDEVAKWVAAGGTLVVFGSHDSNTQWMTAIFKLGIHSSSNGIVKVNDASHPVLHRPDELDYGNYDPDGQHWKFKGNADDAAKFMNIIGEHDDSGTQLSLSKPGAFGKGNLVVTAFYPYDIYQDGGSPAADLEGARFVNNLLMIGYRALYLDYGPEIPTGLPVIPAITKVKVVHPQLGEVQLDLNVYVFPGGG